MPIVSFSPFGYEGALVVVEVDLRKGIPGVDLVGLADNAVKEARERMRAAIRNSNLEFPFERVLISLSPADLKKEGSGFDLAIALAVLSQKTLESENFEFNEKVLVMGELELSGKVRAVRGIHAAVLTAAENKIEYCIIPKENAQELGELSNLQVFPVDNLAEANKILMDIVGNKILPKADDSSVRQRSKVAEVCFEPVPQEMDFSSVKNQSGLVRALQIAVAGNHNFLVFGPPGCGKTLSIERVPYIKPCLTDDEGRQVTRIWSIAGLVPRNTQIIKTSPFRTPHQSASLEGIVGGGPYCRPGEISLAHNGVLFLDEAAEFKTSVLQSLRIPLESKRISLNRAGRQTVFPADFQLLIATNPCPCGNFGSKDKICLCSAHSVEQYWRKLSGPLLDRIEIRFPLFEENTEFAEKANVYSGISTEELRIPIKKAVSIQRLRQGKYNSSLNPDEIAGFCKLSLECSRFLDAQAEKYDFSGRAIHATIKVARTIADMKGEFAISLADLEEAVFLHKSKGGMEF